MRKSLMFLLTLAVIMLFGMSALAQDQKYTRANVPFAFMFGDKLMPAGTYEVMVTDNTRTIQLKNLDTKDVAMVEVMTRLAAFPKADGDSLTFDVVGNQHVLETYWPHRDDGFLLHTTPGKHTHTTIKVG